MGNRAAATETLTTTTTIRYTYDPLQRLTGADYSGAYTYTFAYAYDKVGNRTVQTQTITSTLVTTYTYNAVNQIVTAKVSDDPITWYYSYDANGSLTSITPNGLTPGNGARRYTYNSAGYLVQAETHNGTAYQPQAEMVYNGLGQRISLTAWTGGVSITTRYVLDSLREAVPLAATANGQTTFYLHGRDPLAELTSQWTYYLGDSNRTVRQLSDASGSVTLSRSYTPWGELLNQQGSGKVTWGHFGGLLDATTGLIYAGNGQYYDPKIGRFLSPVGKGRNPYLPASRVDPLGAILGPLAILSAMAQRNRKRRKWLQLVLVALVLLAAGGMLVACNPPTPPTPTPPEIPVGILSSWTPEEPILLPDLTSLSTTDHQTVLNSTVRIEIDPLGGISPCPTPQTTLVLDQSTATYMGNGHLYTHRHGFNEQLPAQQESAAVQAIKSWDGIDLIGEPIPLKDAKITPSGRGHLDIQLPAEFDQVLTRQGILPARRGDPNQLVPLRKESVVAVPVWNGGRYDVVDLLYVKDVAKEMGEPAGLFAKNSLEQVVHGGDSGGGLWFRGTVVGNTWTNYLEQITYVSKQGTTVVSSVTVSYGGATSALIPPSFGFP